MNRRTFNTATAAAVMSAIPLKTALAQPQGGEKIGMLEQKFQIGMVAFENMTNLDLVGPHDMLSRIRTAEVNILAKSRDPIETDSGARLLPDLALSEAQQMDLLFVPGGPGSTQIMEDPEVLDFLKQQANGAKWITSVCTGALVLGAAGLLEEYKAATHWTVMDLLPLFGAEPTYNRVVIDRNRVTGGGVTAGIDFGLALIAQIWGQEQAQLIQLGNEYNPAPPFNAGSPETAPSHIVEKFRSLTGKVITARREAAQRYAAKTGKAY